MATRQQLLQNDYTLIAIDACYRTPTHWVTAGRDRNDPFSYLGSRHPLAVKFLTLLTGLRGADYFEPADFAFVLKFVLIACHKRKGPGQSRKARCACDSRVISQRSALSAEDLSRGFCTVVGAFKGKGNIQKNRITLQAAELYRESEFLTAWTKHDSFL